MGDVVLNVENLRVAYGPVEAVKGISFHVERGEVVSLIGANGAGKTSTLRALSGMVPIHGKISFLGEFISGCLPHLIVKKGLIHAPEGRGIFLNLTVKENLELGAFLRSDSAQIEQDMKRCFELFPRIKERLNQSAGTLSGGEQQMLAISRALMSRPKVLMLDEPSLGLAPKIVLQIFEIIKHLNTTEGMTILLVEQNASMALKNSHRAYVLETGEISLSGKGQDLLNDPEVRKAYLGG